MWREHCSTVNDRRGNMRPEEEIRGQQGYISVFGFSEGDANIIRARGHSRDFKEFAVGSKTLIMDFDNGVDSAITVSERLVDLDVRHFVYQSGGKGCHILADCEEGYSESLPGQHKDLALSLSPDADTSIYRANALIRLPGTVHERTGHRKELLWANPGSKVLELPAPRELSFERPIENSPDALFFLFSQAAFMLESEVTPGRRHDCIWRMVNDCYRAGLSFSTTVELCLTVNQQFKPPKDEADILRVVEARYK